MNENQLKEIFFNRAEVENAERIVCDNCFEHIVFILSDKQDKEVSLGLSTVLECIAFAISNGDLPNYLSVGLVILTMFTILIFRSVRVFLIL